MHVTVTGATGLVGSRLVQRLQQRGDRVTVLSRNVEQARAQLGDVEAFAWDPSSDPAPTAALEGRDAIVNLAGSPVFQRWTTSSKQRIEDSRVHTTAHLVRGIATTTDRPSILVSGSASGYYGDTEDRPVSEDQPPADDFLGKLAQRWETAAHGAEKHGLRVTTIRTGMVLAADGGALPVMLRPFRVGLGGWLGSGRQYVPWIHVDDEVGLMLAALDDPAYTGAINASAPNPVTNKQFSKAVGRAIHRPVLAPAPAFALRLLLGERAAVVLDSSRMIPARAEQLGYAFAHPDLDGALTDLLG